MSVKVLRETHRIPALHGGDALGSFTLRLYWDTRADGRVGWVEFELFEVVGTGGAPSLDGARAVASGMVKWDGCTQFEVASVHIDELCDLENLFHGIRETRKLCAKAMAWSSDLAGEYDL